MVGGPRRRDEVVVPKSWVYRSMLIAGPIPLTSSRNGGRAAV